MLSRFFSDKKNADGKKVEIPQEIKDIFEKHGVTEDAIVKNVFEQWKRMTMQLKLDSLYGNQTSVDPVKHDNVDTTTISNICNALGEHYDKKPRTRSRRRVGPI